MRARDLTGRLALRSMVMVSAMLGVIGVETANPQSLTATQIQDSVQGVARVVQREYFDPSVADGVADLLRRRLSEGTYTDATTPEELADRVNQDLFGVTQDRHLAVTVIDREPSTDETPDANRKSRTQHARRTNFGMQRVEILPGNVGYLGVTSFYRPEEAREALGFAMGSLRHADALIIDLRNNSGGSPGTVALLLSYLFEEPALPLFEIAPRPPGEITRYATARSVPPAERNGRRPVFALTAAETFSAGEGLAFILQDRNRGRVVGERTTGAANPGRPHAVNDLLEVTVPNGRVAAAVTRGNWEGVGVVPDVNVTASDALHVAHMEAVRALIERTSAGRWRDTLVGVLATLEQ